jgi:hypothetical protein
MAASSGRGTSCARARRVPRARRAPTRRVAADVARASPGVGRGECQYYGMGMGCRSIAYDNATSHVVPRCAELWESMLGVGAC